MQVFYKVFDSKEQNNIFFYSNADAKLPLELENETIVRNLMKNEESTVVHQSNNKLLLIYVKAEKQDAKQAFTLAKNEATAFKVNKSDWNIYFDENYTDTLVFNLALGVGMGCYLLGFYKKKQADKQAVYLSMQSGSQVAELQATIDSQYEAMHLVNKPANIIHAHSMRDWAFNSAKKYGYDAEFYDHERLKALGFGALLAVGAGSPQHDGFLKLTYSHPSVTEKPIVLIGKGVTFDTGGYSIKDSKSMFYMKCDMGGGAAVLGAMELIAKLKLETSVIGLVPMAQNSISGNAYLPGDVIKAYDGHTIEIVDTDAEGRLLLADATGYAVKNLEPKTIIHVATLTGSSVKTFGYSCAALFSNNEDLSDIVRKSGADVGERAWPLPAWPEYSESLQSDVADIRNLGGPVAGATTAAKFVQFFTDKHPSWAHLDIAGVAFGNSSLSKDKSATGFGVRLLKEVVKNLS